MNWDRVQGNWKQFSGKVKEKWGQLTISPRSTATASSSKARFKLATVTRRIR